MSTKSKSLIDREKETEAKAKQDLSISLQELRADMSVDARKEVADVVGKSHRLIDLYLGGYVGDIATAKNIIKACRKNIIKREQQLAKAS